MWNENGQDEDFDRLTNPMLENYDNLPKMEPAERPGWVSMVADLLEKNRRTGDE